MTPKTKPRRARNAADEALRLLQVLIGLLDTKGSIHLTQSDKAADLLLAFDGKAGRFFYDDSTVLEFVELELAGFSVTALRPKRAATPDELAAERARLTAPSAPRPSGGPDA